jgi:hypothetical protein
MLYNVSSFIALLIVAVSCATTFADTRQKSIPNTIDLSMGAHTLKFEHKKHIKSVDSVCIYCHLTEKGKIDGGFGNDTARILCIPCHDKEPNLMTDCKGCHTTVNAIISK